MDTARCVQACRWSGCASQLLLLLSSQAAPAGPGNGRGEGDHAQPACLNQPLPPLRTPCRARQLAQKTGEASGAARGPENMAADLIKRREEQQKAATAARLAGGEAAGEGE